MSQLRNWSRRHRAALQLYRAIILVIVAISTIGCVERTESIVKDEAHIDGGELEQHSTTTLAASDGNEAQQLSSKRPMEIVNAIGMRFRLIPAGKFLMGSDTGAEDERPVHEVRITKPFYLGVTEVTQEQWEKVTDLSSPYVIGSTDLPMDMMTWHEAVTFCKELSKSDSTYDYRLPTEAEWEFACRAGTTGDHYGIIDGIAWYQKNGRTTIHPVAQKEPNAFGLHDMSGNVLEWCQDWYAPDYYQNSPAGDPSGPENGRFRVMRGGAEWCSAEFCRSQREGLLGHKL